MPRLLKALASWSCALDLQEAGGADAMAKHILQSLGCFKPRTKFGKKGKMQEIIFTNDVICD